MEDSDRRLLDRFLEARDESAFGLLVRRHLDLVHSVARRVTASEDLARDAAQLTFVRLAQRAALIPPDVSLPAWLHRTSRSLAIDLVRSEVRRKRRESAVTLHGSMNASPETDWARLAPVIDELVDTLPAADRELVLAKYYRNESHASIAARLGWTEANARKRASRALERLRALLLRRGIATSAAALAALLPTHAVTPAPGSLAGAVAAAAGGVAPVAPHTFSIHLAMTTLQKSSIAAAAVVFLASLGYAIRGDSASGPAPAAITTAPPAPDTADRSPRGRTLRPLPATAEGRLERLREILALTSYVERNREMLDFLDLHAARQFPETAENLKLLGILPNRWAFELTMARWAKVEPLAAVVWETDNLEAGFAPVALRCWGETDPDAAIDWVMRTFSKAAGLDKKPGGLMAVVLSGLFVRDPAAAVKSLAAIPDEQERAEAMVLLASHLQGLPADTMDTLIGHAGEGEPRSRLISWSVYGLMHKGRAPRALELLLSDEGAQREVSIRNFFQMWQSEAPAEALAHISELPEKARNEAVAGICLAAVNGDPPGAFALLEQHPGAASDMLVARMAEDCPIEHVGFAMERVLRLNDAAIRDELLTRRLAWWRELDEKGARSWIENHPVPAAVLEALNPPESTEQ